MNTYAYVGANPVNFFDPFGLDACACHANAQDSRIVSSSMAQGPLNSEQARDMSLEVQSRVNNIANIAGGVSGLVAGVISLPASPAVSTGVGFAVGQGTSLLLSGVMPARIYNVGDFVLQQQFNHNGHTSIMLREFNQGGSLISESVVQNCRNGT